VNFSSLERTSPTHPYDYSRRSSAHFDYFSQTLVHEIRQFFSRTQLSAFDLTLTMHSWKIKFYSAFALLLISEIYKKGSKDVSCVPKKTIANSQKTSKPSWPSTWPRYPCRPRQPSCDPRRPHLQPLCRRCSQPCACPHSCFYVSKLQETYHELILTSCMP
jgi:hypothetical protein